MATAIAVDRSATAEKLVGDPAGADSSSLAYNRELVADPRKGPARCPRKAEYSLLSRATGQLVPLMCGVNSCEVCGPKKAFKTAVAVDLQAPERFVRLSLVGDTHQQRRKRLNHLVWSIRNAGFEWEHWGVTEENPALTGYHMHLWQKGSFLDQGILQQLCHREGMGIPYIERWEQRAGSGPGTAYGIKAIGRAATLYGVKGVSEGGLDGFLAANGGRYGHWTRGFFGQSYREALKEAVVATVGAEDVDPGPWYVVRETVAAT